MGRHSFYFHWHILIPAVLLSCLGLVTLLSIETSFFYQQLVIGIVGIIFFFIVSRFDFSVYTYIDKIIYISCVIFLILTFLGPSVRGSTRWLEIGSFQIQPSEIIKPLFLLSMSSLLISYPPTTIKRIGVHLILFLIPFILIFQQPDLGNAIVYSTMWLTMVILAGIPLVYLLSAAVISFLVLPLFYTLLREYQRLRIMTFLNPLIDPRGAGYNAIQAMIAVGSGKLLGRGFGRGTQSLLQFLPEHHTDFIFATYAEEFGFVGAAVLLALFFILLLTILGRTRHIDPSSAAFLYSSGFFAMVLVQVVVNIGMNMGVVPITGITLPFVSYGGSSLLSLWLGLGLLISAYNTRG